MCILKQTQKDINTSMGKQQEGDLPRRETVFLGRPTRWDGP
jgi:hypothetical protein